MNRKHFLLIAVSLALIVGTIVASIHFIPQDDQGYSIAPPHLSNPPHNIEFFTFGDQAGDAIFLNLTTPQPHPDAPRFTLVGAVPASTPAEFFRDEGLAHCSAGIPLVSPPPGVRLSVANAASGQTAWDNVKSWLTSQFNEQYAVTLWSPTSSASDYQLVSMYNLSVGGDCTSVFDEDV